MRYGLILLPLCLALAALAGCAGAAVPATASSGAKVQVVTTLPLFADFARRVGGDRVQVTALLPPGAEPHTFQATPTDAVTVGRAQVIVSNGLGLEEFATDLLNNAARRDAVRVVLADGLEVIKDEDAPGGNPHMWLDPRLAMRYVEKVRDALARADPAGAATYRGNAETYVRELEALDREIEAQVHQLPPRQRKLVTFHDAFAYFARRYGLEVIGVVLRSPGSEPSAREIADLVRKVRAENVRAVFAEPQFNPRLLELVARDAGVQVRELYSDALDQRVPTYVDLMRFNARQVVEGLRGGP